jgi:hypothetical protein
MAHDSHRFPETFAVLTDSLPTVRPQTLAQERAQKAWRETASALWGGSGFERAVIIIETRVQTW